MSELRKLLISDFEVTPILAILLLGSILSFWLVPLLRMVS